MTTEEIKKIAEEYAKELFPEEYPLLQNGGCDLYAQEVIEGCISAFECHIRYFLEAISTRYCIVERGKVVEQHKAHMDKMKQVSSARAINRAKAIALEQIFGASMFNQNEE